jgi:hypothetical protein
MLIVAIDGNLLMHGCGSLLVVTVEDISLLMRTV